MIPMTDAEIVQLVRQRLYVAAVCDILDELGYRQQAMHQRLRPLLPDPKACGFLGRARTFQWMNVDFVDEKDPYGVELEAMDSLSAGEVAVHSTDFRCGNAPWGELMSTLAKAKGVVGCVCDSQIRDCVRIMEMGFPVYYAGIRPLDSKGRGRVTAYNVPIACGEVLVRPGEWVYADFDGIVVIPRHVEAKVFELAEQKAGKESQSRAELLAGASLRQVYGKYGVL